MSRSTRFLNACRGQAVDKTPVWIMRQAGRFLPSYRKMRMKHDFLSLCHTPELACEVTLLPIRELDVDAAILFSDILIVPEAMGMNLDFCPAPIFENPLRTWDDIDRLDNPDMDDACSHVAESIHLIVHELDGRVPLIGFAGAPMTVAAYMIQGGGSKTYAAFKQLLYTRPDLACWLLERVTASTVDYLDMQIRAGVQAVQIFESLAGFVGPQHFERFALSYVKQVVGAIKHHGVPIIYFPHGAPLVLDTLDELDVDVISVDWRIPLADAIDKLGVGRRVQGNLDPAVLLSNERIITREARAIMEQAQRAAGHVFNLGHGIWPQTDPHLARHLVDVVHEGVTQLPESFDVTLKAVGC